METFCVFSVLSGEFHPRRSSWTPKRDENLERNAFLLYQLCLSISFCLFILFFMISKLSTKVKTRMQHKTLCSFATQLALKLEAVRDSLDGTMQDAQQAKH